MPTDTIYGIVGSAFHRKAVERLYRVRHRDIKKPLIVLIGSLADLERFGVHYDAGFLGSVWPGPASVILRCPLKKFSYLHRGTKTIAFRLPDSEILRSFLRKTGPLAAPSANTEGDPPAITIRQAQKYFGDKVDFYVDGGMRRGKPSTLISINRGRINVLRRGSGKLSAMSFRP